MGVYKQSVFIVTICTLFVDLGSSERTSKKIYYDVNTDGTPMCFRRFNGTHQIGCSSDRSGNVGVVYVAQNVTSMDMLLNATTGLQFIVVTNMQLFSQYARKMIPLSRVRGVVILNVNDSDIPKRFSPDLQCPNDGYGEKESCSAKDKWNEGGTGLFFENYPFPVITLQNDTVAKFLIEQCYEVHNLDVLQDWTYDSHLCGMEIKDIMDGAKDTPTCVRRGNMDISLSPQHYCDPLGNYNIFASLRPIPPNETNSVVIIAARLDTFSMFDGLYPGFESTVVSYVTLLAVAEAFGKVKTQLEDANTHLLFILFHGESFDYIGSGRMVYDLAQRDLMNFTIEDIAMFVEIGQIGLSGGNDEVFIHSRGPKVHSFTTKLEEASRRAKLNLTVLNQTSLPPASLQSFVKAWPNISGVVVANHKSAFTNQYYNSMYDKPEHGGLEYPSSLNDTDKYDYVGDLAEHLQKVSTTIARAVYSYVNSSSAPDDFAANSTTIANMLYCFSINSSCELLNATFTDACAFHVLNKVNKIQQRYVGVSRAVSLDGCFKYILGRFLGDVVDGNWTQKTCEEQKSNESYFYFYTRGDIMNASDPRQVRSPQCIRSMANLSFAMSPAFLINNYNWSSREYSTWTESQWPANAMQVRIFMIPSQSQEIRTLVIGIMILILSFLAVYYLERKTSVLFSTASSAK